MEPYWSYFGAVWGPFWSYFGTILDHLGAIGGCWGPFRGYVGLWGPFRGYVGLFGPCLHPFCIIFVVFLYNFINFSLLLNIFSAFGKGIFATNFAVVL